MLIPLHIFRYRTQNVKQNDFYLDKTKQNSNSQGNRLLQATNITKTNNLSAVGWVLLGFLYLDINSID